MLFSNQLPIYEYNLRIIAPDPVHSQIVQMKSEFIRYFGPGLYSRSLPHATIASFRMDLQYENKLVRHLDNTITHQPFQVTLKHVSGFDDIYMVVVDFGYNLVLVNQMTGLKKVLREDLRIPAKHAFIVDRFHITIGQASNSLDYRKAIQLLNTLEFEKEFFAEKFVLVKRPLGKQARWEHCHTFHLEQLQVAAG